MTEEEKKLREMAYDKGYITALESVKIYIMSNFDITNGDIRKIMSYIGELEDEENEEE